MKTRLLDDDFSFFSFSFHILVPFLNIYIFYHSQIKSLDLFFYNVLIKSSAVTNCVNLHTNLHFVSIHIEAEKVRTEQP